MDSLQKLFEQRKYDLLLNITEGDLDATSLWFRLRSLIALGKNESALSLIEDNLSSLKEYITQVIDMHMDLLCSFDRYEKAFQQLDKYDDLGYISMELEEKIKDWRHSLLVKGHSLHPKRRDFVTVEYCKILRDYKSIQPAELLELMSKFSEFDIKYMVKDIKKIFNDESCNDYIKTYLLLVLVKHQQQQEYTFVKHGVIYTVNPYELDPPYVLPKYHDLINKIKEFDKSPYIYNVARSLLDSYIIDIYPLDIEEDEISLYAAAFVAIANKYLSLEPSLDKYASLGEVKKEVLENKIDEIMEVIQNEKPIV